LRNELGILTRYLEGGADPEQNELANKEAQLFKLDFASGCGLMNEYVFSDELCVIAVYGQPEAW